MDQTTFSKSILNVGTYHSPDGIVEVTPARLKHWEKQTRRLQAVGYALPSHFDHSNEEELLAPIQEKALAANVNRSAAATVGKLRPSGFVVAPDGMSAEITIETLTPRAREVVESNAVYVSPVIFPEWKDGAGNEYRDVITSFDLVDHPVDHSQTSFIPAIRMGLNSKPYRLGIMTKRKAPKNRNHAARRARLTRAVRMGTMPPEDEPKADDMPPADAPAADDAPPTDAAPVTGDDSPSDSFDAVDQVLNLLAEFGCKLPDDTDDSNMIRHLRVALTALLNSQSMEDDTQDPEELGEGGLPSVQPGAMPVASAPNIATMSVQHRATHNFAEKFHRETVAKRLQMMLETGRCLPHEADFQTRALSAVRLSLSPSGEPIKSDVDKWLDSRESVPAGTFWTAQQRTQSQKMSLVEAPTQWDVSSKGGKLRQSEVDEAVAVLGDKK